jgi:hypothetical protein
VQPVASGTIRLDGQAINTLSAHARVARGIAQVPEGRQVFAPLSVEDNLRLGAYRRRDAAIASDLDEVYATFPVLADKRGIAAGSLWEASSRCCIGRAPMTPNAAARYPQYIAPLLVDQIFGIIADLKTRPLPCCWSNRRLRRAGDCRPRLRHGNRPHHISAPASLLDEIERACLSRCRGLWMGGTLRGLKGLNPCSSVW